MPEDTEVVALPLTDEDQLLAPSGATNDRFGAAVAINGDTVVAGAFLENANGTASGSVYVIVRSSSTWTQQQKLVASDGAAADHFGCSVCNSTDTRAFHLITRRVDLDALD